MNTVTLHVDQMKALRVELDKAKGARVRVGILGNKANRWGPGSGVLNNPTLGLTHEFGSIRRNIPARSFLRVPLMTRLPREIDRIGRSVWRELIVGKGVMKALRALGVIGENTVQRAFETGGFGKWAPLSPRYARWKQKIVGKNITLLVLSGQLRRSITSSVGFQTTKAGP